ncbi:MAG: aminopeptidase [bacterium]|nr:aminopeptidase [bacterium]MDI1337078.1 aminopeptidase [Lacunisphaera sp.]
MPQSASLPTTFDPALTQGAANAIHVCLKLQPTERMTLITDQASAEIAAALVNEIEQTGADYHVFVLEEYGARPHRDMPRPVLDDLAQSQVSIYACLTQTGELRTRMQMMDVINPHRIRHGHMVNINKQIMVEGMRADFVEVDRLSQKLIEKCRRAQRVTCKTAAGTDYVAELSPKLNWVKTAGLITPAKWGNLPGGEIFTSPFNSNGRFVVDGVVGDYLCQKYGDIGATPLTIDIKDNRIASLACANQELLEEFDKYCHTDENSDRVGEFAIGTNLACTRIIGHILQDEKLPGIHIAFGHPYSEHTGQAWKSTTHIDCVGRFFDIWLDDEQVMAQGTFLI